MSQPESPFAPTAAAGAAYRVLLERTASLQFRTLEDLATLERITDQVAAWARETQVQQTRAAYAWAVQRVRVDARSRYAMFENARAVGSAYASLPKPPE